MHNNYYFLRHLTAELGPILNGTVVSECFSQNKDELVVRFETRQGSFYLRANLSPSFSCLSFPEKFNRARRNSIDLFPQLIGRHVINIRQFDNERSFAIELTDAVSVLFKMHGNRSNVIVFKKGGLPELFKKNIGADHNISLQQLDRQIDWSYEAFEKNHSAPQKLYFTFGKIVWRFLESRNYHLQSVDERWKLINEVRTQLENKEFFIIHLNNVPALSLVRFGDVLNQYHQPVEAINQFYLHYTKIYALEKEKTSFLSTLSSRLNSSATYLQKVSEKLHEIKNESNYRNWGDLIMANMHTIKPGSEEVMLQDFYDNKPVAIRLKKDLSPQKNAEFFYKKAKNQQIEIDFLKNVIKRKKAEIEALESLRESAKDVNDSRRLNELKTPFEKSDTKESVSVPYHEFEINGYRIWVGKNAESNDLLTFKHGYKEDLWLHAKDVAGSHVLVKHQAGKNFPKPVIERAAELAAYNSKRKTDTLCPVIVTPKKFVRKRKGDPPGLVVVEKEDVIMVTPKL